MQVGVLLPHFAAGVDHERLFRFTTTLEQLGFGSVWARDQVGFKGGHAFERDDVRFVDPYITLAAIAAQTKTLILGTAPIIPIRHPVLVAQLVGSLAFLAHGRLIIGMGGGTPRRPFELTGVPYEARFDAIRETAEVLRALATPDATYHGRFATFEDLSIAPAPPADLEMWYAGTTNNAIDRALAFGTGWLPGRCPLPVLDDKLKRLRDRAAEEGRTMKTGIIPIVSVDRDRETALAKIDVAGLVEEANHKTHWVRRMGEFTSIDDMRGVVIAGNTDDVLEQLQDYQERGMDHVILDLRLRWDTYEDVLHQIAADVLPRLKSEGALSPDVV